MHIEREAARQEREVLNSLGNNFWKKDPTIAPLRGALATWGLTIDDLMWLPSTVPPLLRTIKTNLPSFANR